MRFARCLAVDVSNVCWDEDLPPFGGTRPRWDRLVFLLAEFEKQIGSFTDVVLVIDHSLLPNLSSQDKAAYRQVQRKYRLIEAPVADDPLLDIAFMDSCAVLSGDLYWEHRRPSPRIVGRDPSFYRWINDNSSDFYSWTLSEAGEIQISRINTGSAHDAHLSAQEEARDFRDHGFRDAETARRIMQWNYICSDEGCLTRKVSPDSYRGIPYPHGDELHCSCDAPLLRLGERPESLQLKIRRVSASQPIRKIIERDRPITLGRHTAAPDIYGFLDLFPELESAAIEDGSVILTFLGRGRQVVANCDLALEPKVRRYAPAAPPTYLSEPRHVREASGIDLGRRDVLVIADIVEIAQSGQLYPLQEDF